MKKPILYIAFLIFSFSWSQEQLSLDDCYELVTINYPLAKQTPLLEEQNSLDLEIIDKEKLPQLGLSAQATYQSDVIGLPVLNPGVDPLNKGQYRADLSVNQLIYGGGAVNAKTDLKLAELNTQKKQLEVNLYQLKKQVNQLYFSILLTQEKKELLIAKQNQLAIKLNEVKSSIENGMVLPTSDRIIEAELLKIQLQFIDIESTKITLVKTLSYLIGQDLEASVQFRKPSVSIELNDSIYRPELELFQLKKIEIESSEELISKQNIPKFVGFVNGGVGNPGLNPLDNEFAGFYIVGVKMNWNFFDWGSNKKQRQSIAIKRDLIDTESETFLLNTNIELEQLQTEIDKISAFIKTDIEIIALRKEVLESAESQLKNGVITSSAYITELTNLYEDENNLSTHLTELMLVKANYNITKGQ